MTKKTLLILLTLNGLFLDAVNAQSNHCSSMGTDTSFEYIKQVRINTLDNLSGNNEGYGNFTHLNTELDLGQSYEITLTPGYKGSEFNESWNIWIDFNNDGEVNGEDNDEYQNIGAFQGVFKSFGDAPDGFGEELKEFTWALGAEYVYQDAFMIRTGYFNESEEKGSRKFFTLGAGFRFNSAQIDLSYLFSTSQVRNPLENTLRFSLTFNLGEEFYND